MSRLRRQDYGMRSIVNWSRLRRQDYGIRSIVNWSFIRNGTRCILAFYFGRLNVLISPSVTDRVCITILAFYFGRLNVLISPSVTDRVSITILAFYFGRLNVLISPSVTDRVSITILVFYFCRLNVLISPSVTDRVCITILAFYFGRLNVLISTSVTDRVCITILAFYFGRLNVLISPSVTDRVCITIASTGSRLFAFEWCIYTWPWPILEVKSCEFLLWLSRKWWQIGQTLLLPIHRKWPIGFRLVYLHLTLAQSKGQDQRLAYFDSKYLVKVVEMANITSIRKSALTFDWHIYIWPWPILKVKVNRNATLKNSETESRRISPYVNVYAALCCTLFCKSILTPEAPAFRK